jgi:hypothetical protein
MANTGARHYLYEASTGPLPVKEENIGIKSVKRQNILKYVQFIDIKKQNI